MVGTLETKKKEHRGRPRKRRQGTPEEIRGMLFETMLRLIKIAEEKTDDLDTQKNVLYSIAQAAGQWIKLVEIIDVQKDLKTIKQELLELRQAQGLKKVA